MESDLLTERTLNRKGRFPLKASLTWLPRASWLALSQSERGWEDSFAIIDGAFGCVPIHSCKENMNKRCTSPHKHVWHFDFRHFFCHIAANL